MAKKSELILAEFASPNDLLKAAKKVANLGFSKYDTYSPFPIHGMDDAMKLPHSKLGWIVLVGGTIGLLGGFGMQTFMSLDYPIIISGKAFFSYQAFVPVTFELMILLSAFATVFGMFHLNRIPQHYHPIFKSENFRKVTSHGFFLAIESEDPAYCRDEITDLFKQLNGTNIEVIKK